MTYSSRPPPNMNSIGEVCGNHWATGSGHGRDYKPSFFCLHRVEMQGQQSVTVVMHIEAAFVCLRPCLSSNQTQYFPPLILLTPDIINLVVFARSKCLFESFAKEVMQKSAKSASHKGKMMPNNKKNSLKH